ncbi:hypothetical protein ACGFNU_21550 [Spirillospora sp. NPDC048911]|uniref:hypothetical protein n=1 Tax=Spirillospora sp. NPDC048911 TaxID=3364527 RepID=UPI00371703A3
MIRADEATEDARTPGGDIYLAALARRDGRPFTGGAVCWNPTEACEGICRACPRPRETGDR